MYKNTEEILRRTRPQKLSSKESSAMWSKVEHSMLAGKSPSQIRMASIIKRFVLTPLLALSLLGGGTIALADSSRPGDFLFPIDEFAEQVQIALSKTDRRAELRIRFAEERFEEAQDILADYASSVGISIELLPTTITESSATSTATSTDSTSGNTSDSENNTSHSTNSTSDNSNNSSTSNSSAYAAERQNTAISSTKNEDTINNLSQVLSYLEETRIKLIAEGSDYAVPAIDRIISDLTKLAENNLDSFTSARIIAKSKGGDVKIRIQTETSDGKANLIFKKDGAGDGEVKIRIDEAGVKTNIKIDEEKGLFNFSFRNKNKSNDSNYDDHNDDKKERRDKKEKRKSVKVCHVTGNDHSSQYTLKIPESAIKAHLKHGDYRGECEDKDDKEHGEDDDDEKDKHDDDENEDREEEHGDDGNNNNADTTAPTIANLAHTAGTTTAEISWSTNENADGKLWYATSTPVDTSPTPTASESNLSANHSFSLSSLTASTTIYYIVSSTDGAGNTATSSEKSFITLAPEPVDTLPPVIANISVSNISSTTASIGWDTNEDTYGKLWYNDTSPIDLSTAAQETNTTLATSHAFDLVGLTASTTIYYVLSSTDIAGNTSTSTELTLTTL